MSWLKKLTSKLHKTSSNISGKVSSALKRKKLDAECLEELEEILITADVGIAAAQEIMRGFAKRKFAHEIEQCNILEALALEITTLLQPFEAELVIDHKPHIILVCGVNGNGKTTTIGKLAHKLSAQGKKVAIAACDTFRAAAVEQLHVWAQRVDAEFISDKTNADPASVAFKAVEFAQNNNIDVLFIDTAGRLHNNINLMEELAKLERIIKKLDPTAPHSTILTLDATTGQNALMQVAQFNKIIKSTGLVITKLDGTAKAGVLIAVAQKFKMPVYYIGVGEGIDDLERFDSHEFASALVGSK